MYIDLEKRRLSLIYSSIGRDILLIVKHFYYIFLLPAKVQEKLILQYSIIILITISLFNFTSTYEISSGWYLPFWSLA